MRDSDSIVKHFRASLERDPEINLHANPVNLKMADGVLDLEGQVESVTMKRRIRWHAVEMLGVEHVRDTLRVRPSQMLGDGTIRDTLRERLMQERALQQIVKRVAVDGKQSHLDTTRSGQSAPIEVLVHHATVTLRGVVPSLMMKRLLEVLVWWTAGVSCVINRLHVVPNERDSDDEVSDAVNMVLEKDPSLDAGQIAVRVRDRTVTLEGLVPSREHEHLAVEDVWCIPGVHDVVSRLRHQLNDSAI